MDGKDITDTPPAKRDIAMVFQNYAIYPTMTVRENIEFGLKNKHVPKAERRRLIDEFSQVVGLTEYLDRKPGTLSGGQRQRVALARAMVKKPAVFLMDEPLSNLDAKLRVAMRSELIELHNRLKTTFVYVTHDQTEAMSMADQIVLMDHGVIQQEAAPVVIYNDPCNVFTSQFIGTPPMNILTMPDGRRLGFRPEKMQLYRGSAQGLFKRKGVILTREMLGSETLYKVTLADGTTVMVKNPNPDYQMGESILLGVAQDDLFFFEKDGERIRNGLEPLLRAAGGMSDV
jgi:sn-glycerol 3-phosphate transport system ATP-binding protein